MARVLCSISGIEFKCDHFPAYLTSREYHHPIFAIPASDLLSYADRYLDRKFSPTENYLYYLALFNCTDLIDFRVPAIQTQHTQSIIAQNCEKLLIMVERIHHVGVSQIKEKLNLPQFVISPDTKDLSNTKHWIEIWTQNYNDYQNSYKSSSTLEKLNRKEFLLERLIKDKTKEISSYISTLADWAAIAGEFPTWEAGLSPDILRGKRMSLSDYWKYIIRACARAESIFEIPDADIQELIEHCEDNIEHGSIYAHALMAILREGSGRKRNYLDLGDIDIGSRGTVFKILDADSSVEDANKLALIDSAPSSKPIERDYPNKLAFLKARTRWEMAESYRKSNEIRDSIDSKIADSEERLRAIQAANEMNKGRRKDDPLIDKL